MASLQKDFKILDLSLIELQNVSIILNSTNEVQHPLI